MASKPLIALARWADLVGSFVADPSSGERDTGFEDGNPAEADKVNALLLQLYLWALYLDGAVLSGSHAIDGSFTVGGQPLVFADFAYTADAGTDTLTKTAHGLETGDGQVRTTNSGGGLPGGLAAGTDYFAIKTGANTFKLATTRALALAGTAIDITSAGTGTHTLIDQPGTTRVTDATVTRNLTVDGGATVTGPLAVASLATFNGGIGGPLSFSSLSPAALSAGNNNNYNPTGLSTAVIVRLTTAGGSPFITGISGGSDGRILHLYNVGADTITIPHLDGSSSEANQFLTPTAGTLTLATNQSMTWIYDGTSSRWRLSGKNF